MSAFYIPDGGTGGGTGGAPHGGPYSLEIKDSPGVLAAQIAQFESEALSDAQLSALLYAASESATLSEGATALKLGTTDAATLSEGPLKLTLGATESETLTDVQLSALSTSQSESETLSEGTPSIGVVVPADSATLSEARDSFIRCYCSTATGTNVTSPTNAQGANDGTSATMAPTITNSTATLVCTIGGIPSSGTYSTKKLYLWLNFTAAKGTLATWNSTYTTTMITTATAIATFAPTAATSYLVTPFIFDVSGLTMAQLAGLKITFTDTNATGDTSFLVDACALVLEGGI